MTHEFKHPKYYTELRKLRNKSDQAISYDDSTESQGVRPGPGLKLDVPAPAGPSVKPQASSAKLTKHQAASVKPRGTSIELQAASVKLLDYLPLIKFYGVKGEGLN